MTDRTYDMAPDSPTEQRIVDNKWLIRSLGGISIIAGFIAIFMPYIASVAAEIAIGSLLLVTGFLSIFAAFRADRSSHVAAAIGLGAIAVIAGGLLQAYPWTGLLALTSVLVGFLIATGAVKLYYGFRYRNEPGFGWLIASGAASLLLGGLVLVGLPGAAFWVIGLILGVDLIFYGIGMISLVDRAKARTAPS